MTNAMFYKSFHHVLAAVVVSASAFVQAAVFDVRDYGARGDGVTKDTEAIQKAIDAATAAGGGTVELGAGTYLSGTIWLRDGVDFHLGTGAVLLASPDRADYNAADAFPQNWASAPSGDNTSGGHLIVGVGVKGVTLRGPGRIDGNSKAFLVDPRTGTNWEGWKKGVPWRPGQMIEIVDSSDVRLTDLEIADSPYWSCYLLNCTRVWIRGCYVHDVRRPWKTWNGDGFDLDRCQHVTLSDCRIDTEDDGITLRASSANRLKAPQDCAYVTVANCSISSSCNGIRFGVGEGRIHDVVVDNVVFSDTRTALNFVGAYGKGARGTDITDIRVSNVRAEAECLVYMYHRFSTEALFRNIVFDGMSAKTSKPSRLEAAPTRPFEGIVFRNVDSPAGVDVVNAEVRIEGGNLPRVAPSEAYAREEFARYVTRMTGRDYDGPLEIVLDDKLGKEEFAVTKRDGRLSIRGGVRGVLYGVYDVLEKFGGVRWYSSWCEKVPKAERLVVPEGTDYSEKPAFWVRLPYWIDILKHPDFAARLRVNGHLSEPLQPRHGGPAYCLDRKFGFSHTFNFLVPPAEFKDTHPEYFSEIGGKRVTERTQLCLTNPEVYELVLKRLREAIAENPEANMYALAHNDYKNWCECAKCKAINDAADNPGMTEFLFVNKVVTEIAKERPDILFKLSAYVYTRKPPKDIKLHPNVMVDLCPIEADLVFPLPESKCKDSVAFCRDMEGWSKVRGDNFLIWDYNTSFLNLLQILPNAYTPQGNARYYRSMGVNMVFNQGDYTGYHADFAELKAYLQAKWAWNPDLPAEPLVADFFEGYFGPAAPFIREFFDDIYARQRAHCADGTHFMTCYTEAAKELAVDGEFFRKSAALWARAKAAVRGDPTFEYNVKTSALSFLYTALCLNGKRYFLTAHPEEFGPETDAYRLAKTCVETMSEAGRKRGGMVRLVEDIVRHRLRYAGLENIVRSGPADKSVKTSLAIPAKDFGRSRAFVLTNDVARFDRGRYDWVTALNPGNLAYDKGVRYRLRMHVKVERSADMPDGIAFKGGYHDPENKVSFEKSFKASEASADWAWYDIGETEFGPRGLFWISSGTFDRKKLKANPCIGAVLIDKVEISVPTGVGTQEEKR